MSVKKTAASRTALSVVGLILCIVFGLLLICNVTIIVKGVLSPERPPSVLGVTPLVVQSGSMSGTAEDHIEVGDLILVKPVNADELKTGDVISYTEDAIVVTHRIVDITTGQNGERIFRTKGDANNTADDLPVTADRLVGRYVTRIPKLGDLAMFLQTPIGMAVFVGIPVCAFIFYDIVRRRRSADRESEETARLREELERLRAQSGGSDSDTH